MTKQAFNSMLKTMSAITGFTLLPRSIDQALYLLSDRSPADCKFAVCNHGRRLHKAEAPVVPEEACALCTSEEEDVVSGAYAAVLLYCTAHTGAHSTIDHCPQFFFNLGLVEQLQSLVKLREFGAVHHRMTNPGTTWALVFACRQRPPVVHCRAKAHNIFFQHRVLHPIPRVHRVGGTCW